MASCEDGLVWPHGIKVWEAGGVKALDGVGVEGLS